MILKSLELQGFKTFPEKTVLTFEEGITAVVGPNGSGKSNISDAIRWVLGEQSARVLRCSKMEDVIFGGSATRKPMGYAQVTLNIDNQDRALSFDADQVAVARRYYRSGESEYLINNVAVRLRDIHELFMDTGLGRDGYSMIGQGKIDSIVAAKSEERREIFDEAAGISRYRYRKEEAERRLQKAEENLIRLRDIVSELEGRVEPLREQSEKAQKFLLYSEEKKKLEIGLWLETLNRSATVLREQSDKISVVQGQYDELSEVIDQIGVSLEECYQKINGCAAKVEDLQHQILSREEESSQKAAQAVVLEGDIRHNEQNIERIRQEQAASVASEAEILRNIEEKEKQAQEKLQVYHQKNSEYVELTDRLQSLRANMDSSAQKVDSFTEEIISVNALLSEAKVAQASAAAAIEEVLLRLEDNKTQEKTWQERLLDSCEAKKLYTDLLKEAQQKIESAQNSIKGREMRLESRKKRADEARRESEQAQLNVKEQERRAHILEELERNMEGFQQSVKTVVKEASHGVLKGIRGPVTRLLQVPTAYTAAIETALGAALQNIITETEEDAKHAIQLLKSKNAGRATFLPMSVIKGRALQEKGLEDCPGFVGIASELCSCDTAYEAIKQNLLGRIVVADEIDSAIAIARRFQYKFKIVTLDGQVLNAGGSMTGGSHQKNAGILSRAAEIERIHLKISDLEQKAQQAQEKLAAALREVSAEEAVLSENKAELYAAQEDKVRVETQLHSIESECELSEKTLAMIAKEEKELQERRSVSEKNRDQAEEKIRSLEETVDKVQKSIDQASAGREVLEEKVHTLSEHLQELRFTAMEAQKDADSITASAEEMRQRLQNSEDFRQELKAQEEKLLSENEACQKQIEELRQQASSLKEEASALRGEIEEVSQERTRLEGDTTKMRGEEKEKSNQRELCGHELARLEERKNNLQTEYDTIISKLWEEYELTRREAEEIAEPVLQVTAARKRLSELKSKIKGLGTVNVGAIEEYKEVYERYTFMTDQIGDIEKSKAELQELIRSLMSKMKELFLSRFSEINRNFGVIFKELFGGGTGSLSLSDPENVLESGISINVQPPGKVVTNLELLSGGEKALVAICIYFAIMKVSPPPFCVLDEIEAALDEVNVVRFAGYLRRMNKNTQFILITHRRGSMEEADVLYGVTMQNEGMSKLLELHPFEVEEKLGMKTNG